MDHVLLKPGKNHDHLYAIVRVDQDAGDDVPLELRVTVKKVVHDPHRGEAEVLRLNALNAGKGSHYFLQVTRLEPERVACAPLGPIAQAEPTPDVTTGAAAHEPAPALDRPTAERTRT